MVPAPYTYPTRPTNALAFLVFALTLIPRLGN